MILGRLAKSRKVRLSILSRFTFCFLKNIIHTGDVYSLKTDHSHAEKESERYRAFPRKKRKESTAALSYCAFWTKRTMRPARQSFGETKNNNPLLPDFFSFKRACSRLFSCREVSVSGNNQDPGGSERREGSGAKRSNKAHGRFPSGEVRRIKEVERKK